MSQPQTAYQYVITNNNASTKTICKIMLQPNYILLFLLLPLKKSTRLRKIITEQCQFTVSSKDEIALKFIQC